ncbi:unnamed protein product [Ostreobium quekettii]|uniref:protein-ribulosamine 3-kinase n=1 Tax=Ostreobium quekettii TaxID=121088 RepID=A0A8S1J8L3_9CHLO|nr:unnamed protein product [Ostreobium quekettii]|eukprot:evm.model.scf_1143.4 EVM.evm.TU.scf_1143.4   scf_1143:26161-30100(+)
MVPDGGRASRPASAANLPPLAASSRGERAPGGADVIRQTRWPGRAAGGRRGSAVQAASGGTAERWIEDNLDMGPVVKSSLVGSSGWSSQYIYETDSGVKLFVKTSRGSDEGMFKGEALGLQAMYDTHTMRIPKVYHFGVLPANGGSFIVMEHLNFSGRASHEELGRRLAQMHLAEPQDDKARKGLFGFPVDNTIGGTPQPNGWMDNWVDFFRERRLRHQLELAGDGRLMQMGERLMASLETFFDGVSVKPSVLHGDLWSGNIAAVDGEPSIFDPAVYYGHHEAEFGMSWCAGFSAAFWKAYHDIIPRSPGFEERKKIYLLYHYLNHYNLFGSGYYGECQSLLSQLTRKL